uniref:Pentatricopeptide repeat-containing protein At5g48910 n=1 Tax=Anthurium amnicola TaxID=1678845 RepID=A0A1D1YC47_9ARAE
MLASPTSSWLTHTSPCPPSSSSSLPSLPLSALAALRGCRTMGELQQLHAAAVKTGYIGDPLVAAEILRSAALSGHRDLRYARLVFDRMEPPNVFSWNTIIRAFSESGDRALEGVLLYGRMLREDDPTVKPNKYTFPPVLKACAQAGAVEEARQVHGQTIKLGWDSDGFVASNLVRVYAVCGCMEDARRLFHKCSLPQRSEASVVLQNAMIDGYMRLGVVEDARRTFDGMPQRSVISWNAMVAGYAQNGAFKRAVDVFHRMQMEGMAPNYVTLVSVLPAISRLGALELGKWVHMYAKKNRIEVDDVLGSALVDMYAKCGNIEKARQVFEELPKRNPITWSSLIGGLALHGRAEDAIDQFERMERGRIIPTDVVFIGVLNACSHGGLVDRGRSYFDRMLTMYGLKPRMEHYGCMVDMLGRAGLLEEAEQLVLNMPMRPDDVIFKALLSACKIHGNVEMGIRVAKRLIELAPHDSGCYVLLSNLYASLGNWEAVSMVRLMMKELDIKKDPGCSYITLNGVVHEFVVEDDSHLHSKEIYAMLEEISETLRSMGYTPDTKQVLLNVDEEEKESILQCHSEKIAIAFGLVSAAPGTELRIVKNLRVCGDCHSSIKLISKIYSRRIIVRDRSRFHHFENGVCSCKDYW